MAAFNLVAEQLTKIRKTIDMESDSIGDLYEVVFSLDNREFELLQKKHEGFKKYFDSVTCKRFAKQNFDQIYEDDNYSFSGKIIGSDKVENWIIM